MCIFWILVCGKNDRKIRNWIKPEAQGVIPGRNKHYETILPW